MNIDELTLGQIKDLQKFFPAASQSAVAPTQHYPVGKNVIVRTVTMIYTGVLSDVTPTDLILTSCSWIPETERYMKFVETGAVKECEPYPAELSVFINRGALLDMCELRSELPRSQK